ncbi:MAG TPA: ribosome small subunit-dependent GTPase A [Spirochaetota bacterium]|nr:ribosome small subunit-dependent GTPase A [Spirochaetota bacterium]HNT10703.1 ribosome small subunit-dependent GTPase A [Spirochaetota bacterium]HOS41319.1 ribosome small subunit-dependent GTPase A [Spirochaetota bacterium]HPU90285.1 ribosome small subunit-dependent GTPase A [Spirochaetota bacterium]
MNRCEGIIIKAYGAYYRVLADGEEFNCALRGKFRTSARGSSYSDPVVVGDRVLISRNDDGTGAIDELLERRNIFSRKEKGRNRSEDVIASNLDRIIVIQAFQRPRMNLRFADRIIVRSIKESIDVVVCVNKLDLADDAACEFVLEYYRGADVPVLFVSAQTGDGMGELADVIRNRVTLFVGNSGVGKSSILNTLVPDLDLHTIEISDKTGKGRHATTNAAMIRVDAESFIVDTPGLREFGLLDIEPHELAGYFMEFSRYHDACSFRPCTHDHEPQCAVRDMVDEGAIAHERYISYLNILATLREYRAIKYG